VRRGKAEHIAAGTFDMDHFCAEFGQLCADKGCAISWPVPTTNPFERPEGGNDTRRHRPLQVLDPIRDGWFQILDRVLVFDQPWTAR
jgi:hypothetical protein